MAHSKCPESVRITSADRKWEDDCVHFIYIGTDEVFYKHVFLCIKPQSKTTHSI